MGHLLKIRNRESQFLLPVCEMRNCESAESENNSSSITFRIPFFPNLVPIPQNLPKMAKESEWRFLRNLNRTTPRWERDVHREEVCETKTNSLPSTPRKRDFRFGARVSAFAPSHGPNQISKGALRSDVLSRQERPRSDQSQNFILLQLAMDHSGKKSVQSPEIDRSVILPELLQEQEQKKFQDSVFNRSTGYSVRTGSYVRTGSRAGAK